jgi:hypothetical protein
MITAEIKRVDQDEQGAIRVWAIYAIDGVEVQSNYPKIDGHSVYCTRYDSLQFLKMTAQEIKDFIVGQSKAHIETLVRKEYTKISNLDVVTKDLQSLVGQTVQADSVKVDISPTEQVTINQDGTKSEITTKP